jgi:hypothetical protein
VNPQATSYANREDYRRDGYELRLSARMDCFRLNYWSWRDYRR